jgi:hypothetical protein
MNEKLARELADMAAEDQAMRKRVRSGFEWDYSVDRKNTKRLKEIIKEFGWPTVDLVGKEGSRNAWLLVQHADEDRNFQRQILDLIKKLYEKNPDLIDLISIPYLTDRLLVAEEKEQEFGTQFFINDNEKLVLRPLRDPSQVNERRAKYGLYPIETDIKDAERYVSDSDDD